MPSDVPEIPPPAAPYTRCGACGGLGGMHVEGKRGFDRFPCPNANAAPERGGEPVALGWTMLRADGMPTGVMSCERARVERICDEHNRDEVAGFPFRVVALAPVDGASGAAAKRGSEGRTAREEPAP